MITDASLRLLSLILIGLLNWLALLGRATSSKNIELLVLRHEVAVLGSTNPRPRLDWADRALLKLGHRVGASTIRRILKRRRIPPATGAADSSVSISRPREVRRVSGTRRSDERPSLLGELQPLVVTHEAVDDSHVDVLRDPLHG